MLVTPVVHLAERRIARVFRVLERLWLVVGEVRGSDQSWGNGASAVGEVVHHQHATAQPPGPDLEAGSIRGERIAACRPNAWRTEFRMEVRTWRQRRVFTVVEQHLEQPGVCCVRWCHPLRARRLERRQEGHAVAIGDAAQVSRRMRRARAPIGLKRRMEVDASAVLALVLVDDDVALVVIRLAQHPLKDAQGIFGIDHAAVGVPAEPGRDVVRADGAPEHVAALVQLSPAFDAGELAFNTRAVAAYSVLPAVDRHLLRCRKIAAGIEFRHQVVRAGQEERVAVDLVEILGQAPVGLACD